ncbi:MAG: methanogenesis marker 17 protein [Candidatus Syntropharchaeia archaeon]
MEIYAESSDEVGALAYKMLAKDAIAELSLGRLINEVRIYIDIEKPLFFIRIKPNPSVKKIGMEDIVEITDKGDGVEMEITDEKYAPYLLDLLWKKYGEERVQQIERNYLEIKGVSKSDIMALPISELQEQERDALIQDMIFRIIPIGFRITKNLSENGMITYIASENPISEEDIERMEEIMSRPPEELSIDIKDIIKERERELFVPYKGSYV